MRKKIVGVMGGAHVDQHTAEQAELLGRLIATNGWILLNGGRNTGVMAASARGAKAAGGVVVGVLPDVNDDQAAVDLDIAIITGMYDARNVINVLSSDVIIACRGQGGTISEVALALKNNRNVIALNWQPGHEFDGYREAGLLHHADTPRAAVDAAKGLLDD